MTDFQACSVTHPIIRWDDDYNNILDHALEKPFTYLIRNNSGTYEAIDGHTGKIADSNATLNTLVTAMLGVMTSGTLYLKEVAFDLTLLALIPADVRVVCSYGEEYYEYINTADSAGSPFYVNTGVGVNNGYYIVSDAKNRICYASANFSTLVNSIIAADVNIYVSPTLTATLTAPIVFNVNNVTISGGLDGQVGATLTSTGQIFIIGSAAGSASININGFNLVGDGTNVAVTAGRNGFYTQAVTVSNCKISIFLTAVDSDLSNYLVVRNNWFINVQNGVWLRSSTSNDAVIDGNQMEGANYTGNPGNGVTISAQGVDVTNNHIRLFITGIMVYKSQNTISNNLVDANKIGIELQGALAKANTVLNNIAHYCSVAGIFLYQGACSNMIVGNDVSECGWDAPGTNANLILVDGCNNNVISGGVSSYLGLWLVGGVPTNVAQYGIKIDACSNNVIMNYQANDNLGYGIYLVGAATNNVFIGIVADGNGTADFDNNSGATNKINLSYINGVWTP